jgi:hypothetical protein
MILSAQVAGEVATGRITLAYRRWAKPRVRVGDSFLSTAGIIQITAVEQVDPSTISTVDARSAGAESAAAVLAKLRGPETDPVLRIGLAWVGPDPRVALSNSASLTAEDVEEITRRLERLDRRGAWTQTTLELIRAHPGRRAADLAAGLGLETQPFKLDVRKLKELGLTHSLEVGYRISRRGAAYLDARNPAAEGA